MNAPMRQNKLTGRKRLDGRARDSRGKTTPEAEGIAPGIVREILYGAMREAQDPLLRTELGRLRLTGAINDAECSAGLAFAEVVATYDRLKGIPPRHIKGVTYMGSYGKSLREEPDARTIERAVSRYDAALQALDGLMIVIMNLVVYDRMANDEVARKQVKHGLAELAKHFGLTSSAKSDIRKNAG